MKPMKYKHLQQTHNTHTMTCGYLAICQTNNAFTQIDLNRNRLENKCSRDKNNGKTRNLNIESLEF